MKNKSQMILVFVLQMVLSNSAWAAWVSDDLHPYIANNGEYSVDSQSSPYCMRAYTDLHVVVSPEDSTIELYFAGPGTINGRPTEGEQLLTVSTTITTEVTSFPVNKLQRTIIKGKRVLIQESVWNPLGLQFGRWKDVYLGELIQFQDDDTIAISRSGATCFFKKK